MRSGRGNHCITGRRCRGRIVLRIFEEGRLNKSTMMCCVCCGGMILAFGSAQSPPTDVTTSRATIKALYAQNAADKAAIISTQKQLDSGADTPAQLQAIITAKRQDIEKNMRTIEGMLQDISVQAGKQTS